MKTISWFSAGVSSAVATKICIDEIDEIIYTHIDDQHSDTLRFVKDCEEWFGKPVEILQSDYKSVEDACLGAGGRGYVNGVGGAPCTRYLKRRVRKEWELNQKTSLRYVWGLDLNEIDRCERLENAMPAQGHIFPLVERKLNKVEVHRILKASNIKRPKILNIIQKAPGNILNGKISIGLNHPPKKRTEPMAHKSKILAYSPNQNIAYIIPEYSVW